MSAASGKNSKARRPATTSSALPDAAAAAAAAAATQAHAADDERACAECKSRHVDVYCLVCRDFYCAACDTAVHRGKLAKHRRARVTPFYFTRPDARPPSYRCLRHADVTDDSLSYCATCHSLCCKECAAASQHAGHTMIACADKQCVRAVADAVKERLAVLSCAMAEAASRRKDITDVKTDLDHAVVDALGQISERFRQLRTLVSEREAALTAEIIAKTTRLMSQLTIQERACTRALDDAECAILAAERLVQCNAPELPTTPTDTAADPDPSPAPAADKQQPKETTQQQAPAKVVRHPGLNTARRGGKFPASTDRAKTAKQAQAQAQTQTPPASKEKEGLPNTPEAIGTLVDTLHMLRDAGSGLRDMYGMKPSITTPYLRVGGEEQFEQLCGAVRGVLGVSVELPPVTLALAPSCGVWWNAVILEWAVDRSCAAFMKLHADAQFELQARGPSETDFVTVYRGPATEYTVRELLPQTAYEFRCRLRLASGEESPFCEALRVTTSTPPVSFMLKEGEGYVLDASRMVATKQRQTKECWDTTVVADEPLMPRTVHRWFVRLRALHEPTTSALVGVAPATIDQKQIGNGNKCGWYLFTGISSLWSGPPQRCRNRILFGVTPLKAGDSVGIILDTTGSSGVLSFWVSGQEWRIGYSDIPLDTPLVPCVILAEPNDCVEFVVF